MRFIAARLVDVRSRIESACLRAGRDPREVRLVGVSKTHGPETIVAAYGAGLRDFGENRVHEATAKIRVLRALDIRPRWHFVGHLQSNKVRAVLELFDILHSVDSERLAELISARAGRTVGVLIEVNLAGEASKFGVTAGEVLPLAERVGALPNIDLLGLMTVAPLIEDPERVRPVFRRLRELRDAVGLRELSMGMTDDFEVAVEEGSTLVRVGRAIFGDRAS